MYPDINLEDIQPNQCLIEPIEFWCTFTSILNVLAICTMKFVILEKPLKNMKDSENYEDLNN